MLLPGLALTPAGDASFVGGSTQPPWEIPDALIWPVSFAQRRAFGNRDRGRVEGQGLDDPWPMWGISGRV
jgi:hypothetical protein